MHTGFRTRHCCITQISKIANCRSTTGCNLSGLKPRKGCKIKSPTGHLESILRSSQPSFSRQKNAKKKTTKQEKWRNTVVRKPRQTNRTRFRPPNPWSHPTSNERKTLEKLNFFFPPSAVAVQTPLSGRVFFQKHRFFKKSRSPPKGVVFLIVF